MNNQTKYRVTPETLAAYIIGGFVASMLLMALVIAIVNILAGNVHLANGQL